MIDRGLTNDFNHNVLHEKLRILFYISSNMQLLLGYILWLKIPLVKEASYCTPALTPLLKIKS
jgi:hypothetical protein